MNSLFRSLNMILPMVLVMIIYFKSDKEYKITDKISLMIKVEKKWQPAFIICCMLLLILIIGILFIYVINVPDYLYATLNGLITGVGLAFINNLSIKNKNKINNDK